MIRFTLVAAIALCLCPLTSYAQNARFVVTAPSVSIYQAPNIGSPVIGHSSKGAALDVRGEITGWIEVAWPSAANGVAYVRALMGSVEKPAATRVATGVQRPMTIDEYVHGRSAAQVPASLSATGSPNESTAYVTEAVEAVSAAATPRPRVVPSAATSNATYVAPAHFVGLGGRISDVSQTVGGGARVWSRAGLGVQFEMVRDAKTNSTTAERLTSLQFAPSVLYALPNAVSDYVWLRPYLGGGPTIDHSTLRPANATEVSSSDSSLGLRLFGGGEITFAGLPRFALSADVGYRKMQAGFVGFERRKIGFALSGHWFVR